MHAVGSQMENPIFNMQLDDESELSMSDSQA